VRERVRARTWDAYELTALEGLSGAEASTRLGMNVAAVFTAKASVLRMLREEMRYLDNVTDPRQDATGLETSATAIGDPP
jgi:RNA polymerase sigma-70 factor (ECF subfamily)